MDISIFIFSSKSILTRYRHLYKRTEKLTSEEITQSIRAIFGTAHILDEAPENGSEVEPEMSDAQSNTGNTFEEAVNDENVGVNIFICPLCGQDFSHVGSFSDHNKREHKNKIVQLEMFSYAAGKTYFEDQNPKKELKNEL